MLHQSPVRRVPAFASRTRSGIRLLYERGGIYCALAGTRAVRTKHVRAKETFLFGPTDVGAVQPSNYFSMSIVTDLGLQLCSDHDDDLIKDKPRNSDAIYHIPPTEDETDPDSDSNQSIADEADDNSDDSNPDSQSASSLPCNLCSCAPQNYS